MNYFEFLSSALAAIAMASLVYACTAVPSQKDPTSMDADIVVVSAIATFVAMMVAQHPAWLS
jgi:hypothetical protein